MTPAACAVAVVRLAMNVGGADEASGRGSTRGKGK